MADFVSSPYELEDEVREKTRAYVDYFFDFFLADLKKNGIPVKAISFNTSFIDTIFCCMLVVMLEKGLIISRHELTTAFRSLLESSNFEGAKK